MLAGKPPYCINVYRDGRMGSKARRGRLGDKILVAIKGEMRRAYIVGWKMHHKQIVHGIPRSDSNNIVVLNADESPAGSKIMVPIPACLAASKDPTLKKIVDMADTLEGLKMKSQLFSTCRKPAGIRVGLFLQNVGSFLDTVGGIGHTTIQRLKRSARRICPCINARDPMELRQTCLLSIALVGFVLLIAGAVILAILPSFVHNGVLEAISLSNGSKAEKAWENPPYEMSMQVWFFNITNADEVMLYQAKPSLVELGPYGYDEHQRKVAVTYYDNGTMGYQNLKWFEFNASKSCRRCRPLDLVTVPNVPFWTLLHKLRRSGSLPKFKKFISFGLLGVGEGAFITRSIDALLFTGYHDIIFAMAKMFHWLSPDTQVPDRMGFMYGKNFTLDGAYLIKSGQTNYLERGRLELYKGKSSVNVWADVWSNMINGSGDERKLFNKLLDGTLNPPFLERTSRLPLFSPDLCRSLYVDYSEDVHSGGFDAYRFTVPPEVFDDRRAENAGFCWPTDVYYPENQKVDYTTGLACLPSGLLNISKCQMDAPIVLSSPHFLHASKEVQNSVFGLRPNVKEHTTWMDIEPVSGLGIEFQRKLQINVAMVQDSDFSTVKRMRSVIMPVLWLNESAFLNAEAKLDLWHRLFLPQIIAKAVGAILIITGALGSLLAIGFFTHYRQTFSVVMESKDVNSEEMETETSDGALLPEAESCFSLLQDDDEFEEFPDDECLSEADFQNTLDPSVWDENWESGIMEEDFAKQLRAELEKLKAKFQSVPKTEEQSDKRNEDDDPMNFPRA
ncbi:CD36 family protein [Trichuris suis]|nr:CD36 family protein [Trichuris suis]